MATIIVVKSLVEYCKGSTLVSFSLDYKN